MEIHYLNLCRLLLLILFCLSFSSNINFVLLQVANIFYLIFFFQEKSHSFNISFMQSILQKYQNKKHKPHPSKIA